MESFSERRSISLLVMNEYRLLRARSFATLHAEPSPGRDSLTKIDLQILFLEADDLPEFA